MKYKGEVTELKDTGDEAEVAIGNVKRDGSAEWREYSPTLRIRMPHSLAKGFTLGRRVTVNVVGK